jgi:predicted transposase YdaD
MPGRWDTSTKRLVNENPADFIRWLVPKALFASVIEAKSLNLNDREIEADTLYEIVLNDLACLIHIEFQSYYDERMARRMWEYNALATFSYNLSTYSFVIYLKPCKVPEPYYAWNFPTGEPVHFFHEGAAGYPYLSSRSKAARRGTSGKLEHL